jgi:hypothetical protein
MPKAGGLEPDARGVQREVECRGQVLIVCRVLGNCKRTTITDWPRKTHGVIGLAIAKQPRKKSKSTFSRGSRAAVAWWGGTPCPPDGLPTRTTLSLSGAWWGGTPCPPKGRPWQARRGHTHRPFLSCISWFPLFGFAGQTCPSWPCFWHLQFKHAEPKKSIAATCPAHAPPEVRGNRAAMAWWGGPPCPPEGRPTRTTPRLTSEQFFSCVSCIPWFPFFIVQVQTGGSSSTPPERGFNWLSSFSRSITCSM